MELNNKTNVFKGYLKGGGEMGELTRNFDWAGTELGPPETWPVNLLTSVSILLNSRFPMFLWWGENLIQFYNDAYRPSLGDQGKHPGALGAKAVDYWEEIWSVISPLIHQVMNTGEPTWSEDQLIPIYRNGKLENVYWTFGYSSVNDEHGNVCGVMVICNETTEKVEALLSLTHAKNALEKSKRDAENQRDRLKQFLMQAPAGICILEGQDLVYDFVNPGYQQFFPGRNLIGRQLLEAVPEIRDQEIHDILNRVLATGVTYTGESQLIPLAYTDSGPVVDRYFNFVYQAKYGDKGEVDGIIVFAFEVTAMVEVTRELEKAEDKLNLAIEAAMIGTWTVELNKMTLNISLRTAELFGFEERNNISMEKVGEIIVPEDRERILLARKLALETGSDYCEEYSIIPLGATAPKWIRSMGKTYYDAGGNALYMTGAILDISEQKLNENRKNDFISMVSHEMKTPLTSISLYLQLLGTKAKVMENPVTASLLDKVNGQLKKMEGLINGFLNISRLESNKIYLDKERFDLDVLISESLAEFKLVAKDFNIDFQQSCVVSVLADRYKISSVLSNLLNNAMKYSPRGRKISVKCGVYGNNVRVSVADEGMGIKQSEIPKLFERFYRVETLHTTTISGFGIGLYLSAEIVQLHGGRIWVDSEIGIGSVFHFELPV